MPLIQLQTKVSITDDVYVTVALMEKSGDKMLKEK